MAVQGRIIRFGLFQIDPAAAELRKDGIRIKLQEQPFQILVRLLECPGNIVTRDDLRNALWPEGTFVDFDHSLNASINKLRDALGDSAANPRFIQTVPKRGYRFIAPVHVAPTHQDPESMMQSEADVPLKRSRSTRLVIAASVVALICAGVGTAVVLRRTATSAPPVVVVSLTTMPGIELEPSFSPDGNFVVYHGRDASSTTSSLFIKSLRSDNPRRLTSGEASDKSPKWSPDGRTIAFVRFTPPADSARTVPGTLMTVSAQGGLERAVPEGGVTVIPGWIYSQLDWFSDSEHVVITSHLEANRSPSLVAVNTRTGLRHQVTDAPSGILGDLDPALSPDGRKLAFTRYRDSMSSDIWILDLTPDRRAAGEPRPLITGIGAKSPAWTPDGREIVFAAGPQHRKKLMRIRVVPPSPPQPLALAAEGSLAIAPVISRRNQLAYPLHRGRVYMYRSELAPDGTAVRTEKMLLSSVLDHLPEFSPSGDRLAFVSNRSGVQEIWVAKADGSDAYQLTDLQGQPEATHPRWSPDGRTLVFNGGGKAWIIDVQGGRPTLLTDDINAHEVGPAVWSLDRKWLYLRSHRSGRAEIWAVPAPGRHDAALHRQITKNGGGVPCCLLMERSFITQTRRSRPRCDKFL